MRITIGSLLACLVAAGAAGAAPEPGPGGRLLLRAAGPSLLPFGVEPALPDPRLTLFAARSAIAENDDWGRTPDRARIAATAAELGAFPWPEDSRDAAIEVHLEAGPYTAHVRGAAKDRGVVLAELYHPTPQRLRLLNLSARSHISASNVVLIAGFALAGDGARTVLIRAVGPSLAAHGVSDVLPDPVLSLYERQTLLLTNDDWTAAPNAADLVTSTHDAGAFPLPSGSRDAALLVTLMPGTYTAHVRGATGATGEVLLEIYAVP